MPRVGRSIKRRGKVPLRKKQKPIHKYKSRHVGDAQVREVWDHKKTARQNYENLGLAVKPNSHEALKASTQDADKVDLDEVFFTVPDSDLLSERNPRKKPNHMSEEEIKYLRPLIAKHADDYEGMAKDIKLNNMQWTQAKLAKRCGRLALLDANVIHQ